MPLLLKQHELRLNTYIVAKCSARVTCVSIFIHDSSGPLQIMQDGYRCASSVRM